jgi:hypothetical protein
LKHDGAVALVKPPGIAWLTHTREREAAAARSAAKKDQTDQ